MAACAVCSLLQPPADHQLALAFKRTPVHVWFEVRARRGCTFPSLNVLQRVHVPKRPLAFAIQLCPSFGRSLADLGITAKGKGKSAFRHRATIPKRHPRIALALALLVVSLHVAPALLAFRKRLGVRHGLQQRERSQHAAMWTVQTSRAPDRPCPADGCRVWLQRVCAGPPTRAKRRSCPLASECVLGPRSRGPASPLWAKLQYSS